MDAETRREESTERTGRVFLLFETISIFPILIFQAIQRAIGWAIMHSQFTGIAI